MLTPLPKSGKYGSLAPIGDNNSVLARIERFTADANEIARDKYLGQIWKFEDLHKADAAPAYVHRLKNIEVKHMGTVGEKLVITNNAKDNVDVYAHESPQVLKTIDIQGRQMNCSLDLYDQVIIGCRDRRLFVLSKSLDIKKVVEVPESVHCLCSLKDQTQIAVGMTDGHVIIYEVNNEFLIKVDGRFPEIGGIWSICAINNNQDIAVGTVDGVNILKIN